MKFISDFIDKTILYAYTVCPSNGKCTSIHMVLWERESACVCAYLLSGKSFVWNPFPNNVDSKFPTAWFLIRNNMKTKHCLHIYTQCNIEIHKYGETIWRWSSTHSLLNLKFTYHEAYMNLPVCQLVWLYLSFLALKNLDDNVNNIFYKCTDLILFHLWQAGNSLDDTPYCFILMLNSFQLAEANVSSKDSFLINQIPFHSGFIYLTLISAPDSDELFFPFTFSLK
jgi:hypothetical protein